MFADSYEVAAGFTRPLVMCIRNIAHTCGSGMGSFVLLNSDGWAVTANHIIDDVVGLNKQTEEAAAFRAEEAEIAKILDPNKRRSASRKLRRPPDELAETVSIWFGADGANIDGDVLRYPFADLAIFRLDGLDLDGISFPKFKRPGGLRPGTSLIKVGYPFHNVDVMWREDIGGFEFDETLFSMIPIEGIYTRLVTLGLPAGAPPVHPEGLPMTRLETSSPGLRGQSGGPTLDRHGVVWAIQSATKHFDLGFSPKKDDGRGKLITEHQFFNAGWGIPPSVLEVVFADAGVSVDWVD